MKRSLIGPLKFLLSVTIFFSGVTGCQSLASSQATTLDADSADPQSASEVTRGRAQDLIRATPYFIAGVHRGFRLYPLSDSAAFEATGLRPGDLLLEVDGRSLTDPRAPAELFDRLDQGERVVAKIKRRDEVVDVTVRMK